MLAERSNNFITYFLSNHSILPEFGTFCLSRYRQSPAIHQLVKSQQERLGVLENIGNSEYVHYVSEIGLKYTD